MTEHTLHITQKIESDFFLEGVDISYLNDSLKRKKLAWVGDTYLQFAVTTSINNKYSNYSVGELTATRVGYISNQMLALYMNEHGFKSSQDLSDHSK